MIWMIAKRELLSNIIRFRFLVSLILCLALITASAFVLTKDYGVRLESYSKSVRDREDALKSVKIHAQVRTGVDRTPSPLGFLCIGSDKDLGNIVEDVSYREIPREAIGAGGGNRLMSVFPALDVVLIIQVVLSLLALMLAYDAISGERESGTLRLSMSNPVPRSTVILGKYLGTMVVLIIPLLMGMLLSTIIITVSGKINIAGEDWIRLAVMGFLSILYVSTFVVLGLFVSSLLRSSAASLVLLLLAWTVMVVVIPDIGGTVTTSLSQLPSVESIVSDAYAAKHKAYQEYNARHPNAGGRSGNWSPRENLGRAFAMDDAFMKVFENYWDSMLAQVRFGFNVTRISPTAVYRRAAEAMAGSGINHYESFMNQVRRYKFVLRDFLLDHYPLDIHQRHDERKLREALSTRPFTAGEIPKFHDDPILLEDSITSSLWNIAILFAFNVVFFMAAYISFLNRDVR